MLRACIAQNVCDIDFLIIKQSDESIVVQARARCHHPVNCTMCANAVATCRAGSRWGGDFDLLACRHVILADAKPGATALAVLRFAGQPSSHRACAKMFKPRAIGPVRDNDILAVGMIVDVWSKPLLGYQLP